MSLSPSHHQAAAAIDHAPEAQTKSSLVERAIAVGFALTVSVAMIGWLYVLALASWNGASWLMS